MGDLDTFIALRSRDRLFYAEKAVEYAETPDPVVELICGVLAGFKG